MSLSNYELMLVQNAKKTVEDKNSLDISVLETLLLSMNAILQQGSLRHFMFISKELKKLESIGDTIDFDPEFLELLEKY